jgi:hypothetical protein
LKTFKQSITVNGATANIRSVSTRTGQFYVQFGDLASALTGEIDPKKTKEFLSNVRQKVQRNPHAKPSAILDDTKKTTTPSNALSALKV